MREQSNCLGVDRRNQSTYTIHQTTKQGEYEMSECEHEHTVLCWKDSFGTDREYEMAFGYDATDGEPTVAIMWEGCEHPISIPVTVLVSALTEGWQGELGDILKSAGFSFGGDNPLAPNLPTFFAGDPALN